MQQQEAVAAAAAAQPAAAQCGAQAAAAQPEVDKKEERKAKFEHCPQIVDIEEKRKDYRATLKTCIYNEMNGRRSFKDCFFTGPWRSRREAAQMDQKVMSETFKYDGDKATEDKIQEL